MDGIKLDLRQLGTLYGNPIYIDVASVPYSKPESTVLSSRDMTEYQARKTMQKAFDMPNTEQSDMEKMLKDAGYGR